MSAAEVPALRRSLSGELSALGALFVLTLRQHTHGRRLIVLIVLFLLPCALALLLRNLPRPAPLEALEISLIFHVLPHGLAPLTALLFAAGVIADEVEEQTLTYLLLRSMPRWALFLTKLLATWCVTAALVGMAVLALYTAIYAGTPEFTSEIVPRAARVAVVAALAQAGYCALFGFLGLVTRRSLIAGIAYIAAIEGFLASVDFVGRKLTIVYYVRSLTLRWVELPEETALRCRGGWGMMDLAKLPTGGECVGYLLGCAALVAVVSAFWFARSEYRVKTPGSD